jgi:hypothetical protein
MAETTGPVLAIGGITVLNRTVFNGREMDWRIPIATGVAAGLFALAEKATGRGAVYVAYLALAAVVLTRVDPSVPSPAESALKWFNAR